MSEMYQRLAHSSWDCKYHVVLCPSGGARCCLARHGASWEKYSTNLSRVPRLCNSDPGFDSAS